MTTKEGMELCENNNFEIIFLEDIEVNSIFKTSERELKDIFMRVSLNCSGDYEFTNYTPEENDENKLKMISGSYCIPKKIRGMLNGQDAHFVHYNDKGRVTIGVVDGVEGRLKKQIDSGIYARELVDNAIFSINQNYTLTGITLLKKILHDSWLNTKAKGVSTACFLTIDDDNNIHATNVGNSGFMVIREDNDGRTIVYKSRVQTIDNAPYQLGVTSNINHAPKDAYDTTFQVKDGDIVVLANNGLFDNVFPHEIVAIIATCRSLNGGVLPPATVVAGVITKVSLSLLSTSMDELRPWTMATKHLHGGKSDGITVIVGYIGNDAFMKDLSGEPESIPYDLGSMTNTNKIMCHVSGYFRSWILPFFNELVRMW